MPAALMLVGANTVRQWLLLVLMGDLGGVRPAVLSAGLVRARLCETLAKDTGLRNLDGLLDHLLAEMLGAGPSRDDAALVALRRPPG